MESRLLSYKKRREKYTKKVTGLFIALVFFTSTILIIRMLPGTFAFFTSENQATGTIQNAISSDLINITTGEIVYEENCKIKSSISIKNISDMDIPIEVEFFTKNSWNHTVSTLLKAGTTLLTDKNEVDNLSNRCELNEIEYRIKGFDGFIDEIYTISVDQQKLKAANTDSLAGE